MFVFESSLSSNCQYKRASLTFCFKIFFINSCSYSLLQDLAHRVYADLDLIILFLHSSVSFCLYLFISLKNVSLKFLHSSDIHFGNELVVDLATSYDLPSKGSAMSVRTWGNLWNTVFCITFITTNIYHLSHSAIFKELINIYIFLISIKFNFCFTLRRYIYIFIQQL